ncbi:hypothetical protein PIROE2DRAFT_8978 [Piromyces sp. E2]|nr:hypothetical protein PIROE2DRAFT_8978 [Piromyces sp. E2]|eukprot:OUM64295.1 hypothetical protein PIROE2DRAFT_8978 [Piromyces sp. E2]
MKTSYAESLLRPDNIENKFEGIIGINDRQYTDGVNNGSYKDFVKDKKELTHDFNGLVTKLKKAKSVRQASNDVIFDLEKPEDQRPTQQDNRAAHGERFYK